MKKTEQEKNYENKFRRTRIATENDRLEKTISIKYSDLIPRMSRHGAMIKQVGKYCGGVYVLWYKDEVVYVGQTKAFKKRLNQHKNNHPNWKWNYLSWIEEKGEAERIMIEAMLINKYQPCNNIACKE